MDKAKRLSARVTVNRQGRVVIPALLRHALKIEPGEELTVDYRFSDDVDEVPCRCRARNCRGTINLK